MNKRSKFSLICLLAGTLLGLLVFLAERSTGAIAWGLVLSFPVCWGIGGYLLGSLVYPGERKPSMWIGANSHTKPGAPTVPKVKRHGRKRGQS